MTDNRCAELKKEGLAWHQKKIYMCPLVMKDVLTQLNQSIVFLAPASAVEVIESELSFRLCVCVCVCVSTLMGEPFDL